MAADYIARQKVGGTHITYNLLKQFPVFPPEFWRQDSRPLMFCSRDWFMNRVLELVFVSFDLASLAHDCGYDGPPFQWSEDRRFEIRCELDAAFFHLYLPNTSDGQWLRADGETAGQLAALKNHFATPRDAVACIMDQFPIVKQRDESAHGSYRTKDRILEIYDEMLAAHRSGRPYETKLNPPPGSPR